MFIVASATVGTIIGDGVGAHTLFAVIDQEHQTTFSVINKDIHILIIYI